MATEVDVLIIGASQAGLAMGYYLTQQGRSFAILGKETRVGDVWRNRYDSLVLFTPRWFSALPGKALAGNPDGYATKDEIADYLEDYATTFNLPIQLNTKVHALVKSGNFFLATTSRGTYTASRVVVATGPFQNAFIPPFAKELPGDIHQVHTSDYKKPEQLKPGNVLVVGAGNSGAQIAVELSQSQEVYFSVGQRLKFFPYKIWGKSLFWWFEKVGLYRLTADTNLGKWIRHQGDPIIGKELKEAIRRGKVKQKQRVMGAGSSGIVFKEGSQLNVQNIIWATGFTRDYSWINISGALDAKNMPRYQRGVSPVEGLYFVGMPWQHNRSSALLGGVGADAKYLAAYIHSNKPSTRLVTAA